MTLDVVGIGRQEDLLDQGAHAWGCQALDDGDAEQAAFDPMLQHTAGALPLGRPVGMPAALGRERHARRTPQQRPRPWVIAGHDALVDVAMRRPAGTAVDQLPAEATIEPADDAALLDVEGQPVAVVLDDGGGEVG